MNRKTSLEKLEKTEKWDVIIIGGGATGLGVAADAASRGYKTLLLEQSDFAKGTSSRSTKLVHGGVRYLAQGNVRLVREALRERGYILKNAPHLSRKQAFLIPVYSFLERLKYSAGMKLYDLMAGSQQIGHAAWLNKAKVIESIPGIKGDGLKGGVLYYDGQFDDARMAVSLAATCTDWGGTVLNYIRVIKLSKNDQGKLNGVIAKDEADGREYQLKAKIIINATGVFVDEIHQMDDGSKERTVKPSQGIHLVLPREFLETTVNALMIPKTDDGRVLFMVPWHDHLLAGTTDTPLEEHTLEPRALEKEIAFILNTAERYLKKKTSRQDVLSVFAGLRPLAIPAGDGNQKKASKDISRNHVLQVSKSGLITITGGKWTTYRKMAEDTVDKAIEVGGFSFKPCITKHLKIHGYFQSENKKEWNVYGSDWGKIQQMINEDPVMGEILDEAWPFTCAEVAWAVREEMAVNVEDVLSRRFRVLFLDAKAATRMAPKVAEIMKKELGKNEQWKEAQIKAFEELASGYLLSTGIPA
ncbi:MAG: glycerol-3-phosphate dehydrogenase/oxidase [Chitinophagaceae bacterium]|nr:MAG: glycerol-3-phosphate dehydrogenase/oxidase [Chitinophagaceae bacterium]